MKARNAPAAPPLPPPSARACWWEFAKWAVGLPLAVMVAGAVVAGSLWLSQGMELATRTMMQMSDIVLWLGLIVLAYPVGLVLWIWDLRDGLRAARDWAALDPQAKAAALAAQAAALPARKRKGR